MEIILSLTASKESGESGKCAPVCFICLNFPGKIISNLINSPSSNCSGFVCWNEMPYR